MRKILLILLIIGCQKNDDMLQSLLLAVSSNNQNVVENKFSDLKLLYTNGFSAYSHMTIIGSRVYVLFRESAGHDFYDGRLHMLYSDDNGENWTNQGEFYNPEDTIWTDFPNYHIVDPTYQADARDSICLITPDRQYLLVICPVAIGKKTTIRETYTHNSVALKIPIINGNQLDYVNKEITYVDSAVNLFVSSTLFIKDGNLFTCGYSATRNRFYKSTNGGSSWTFISNFAATTAMGGDNNYACSEVSLNLMSDGTIKGMGRNVFDYDVPSIFIKTTDEGQTWAYDYTSAYGGLDAPDVKPLDSGYFVAVGRCKYDGINADTNNVKNYLRVYDSDYNHIQSLWLRPESPSDAGYGCIVKYKDRYFVTFFSGAGGTDFGIYFRQLDYNPQTKLFSIPS